MASKSMGVITGGRVPNGLRVAPSVDLAFALHPLPDDNGYAEVTEDGDPYIRPGDVARVDFRVRRYVGDAAYALEIDGVQVLRRIQNRTGGLFALWGEQGEPFNPERMRILGMVKSCQGMRSFSEW